MPSRSLNIQDFVLVAASDLINIFSECHFNFF
jgi:hypothetical protein